MAGVTDVVYRRICRSLGADLTVGEMAASEAHLRASAMTRRRYACDRLEPVPVVQLLGADPDEMAAAAAWAEQGGARIIDINFGCPARMVCGKACGSALMREPERAQAIMRAVRQAVSVPVTVKMRTGWDEEHKNCVQLAQAAQQEGLSAVTVHGRTRAQRFQGRSNPDDIARVVQAVDIAVIANGDVASPEDARSLLAHTKAAGIMIGRAASGNPWLFARTQALLAGRSDPGWPTKAEAARVVLEHFDAHLQHWSQEQDALSAVRSFRKHVRWYTAHWVADDRDRARVARMMRADAPQDARALLEEFFCC